MRILSLILVVMLTAPAWAQGWRTYESPAGGAVAQVPPGFADGPRAESGAGRIFRGAGGAELAIYADTVPGGDFAGHAAEHVARLQAEGGWRITAKTIAPDWAEYTASRGARQLSVRLLALCGGHRVAAMRFVSEGNMQATVSKVAASLRAGPSAPC